MKIKYINILILNNLIYELKNMGKEYAFLNKVL